MKLAKLSFLLMLCLIFLVAYYFFAISVPVSASSKSVGITIEPGQGVSSIAKLLREKELIRSSMAFKIYVFVHGMNNTLQAGDYEVVQNVSLKKVVDVLQHGTFDVRLTFPEGWRAEEMADYISSQKNLSFSGVDFLKSAQKFEGRLFPDTYVVPRYISADDLVSLMVSNFNQKVGPLKARIEASGLSLDEAVIFASIVEREAADKASRPMVAGILLKRLENEWPLQADATVQYVLGYQTEANPENGELKGSWWKTGLTTSDLEEGSPYNTRLVPGLPPSPICNPGLESLQAVVMPKESEYWYYLTDTKGEMHYAVSLEEHNDNIATYLP